MEFYPGNKIGAGLGQCNGGPGLSEKVEIGAVSDCRLWQSAEVTANFKSQITNIKQITMTEIQNSKSVLVI
jgi:hypothetical protein